MGPEKTPPAGISSGRISHGVGGETASSMQDMLGQSVLNAGRPLVTPTGCCLLPLQRQPISAFNPGPCAVNLVESESER